MDDLIINKQPAQQRTPSPRVVLWTELEQLHASFDLAPPTQTLTIEELEAEVERLRQIYAERQATAN